MSLSAKMRRAPLRAVTGAYILNSGVGKLSTDDDTAKKLHGMASGTYGFLDNMQPKVFAKTLGVGEIAVGSVLLLPIVPPVVAGAALLGFSGALLNMYWHTPGLHEEGNPRPTLAGTPIAKDVWMLGIGSGLIADAMLEPAHDKRLEVGATFAEKRAAKSRRAKRKAAKAADRATKRSAERVEHGKAMLAEAQEHGKAMLAEAQEHGKAMLADAQELSRAKLADAQKEAAKRAERAAKRAKKAKKRAQRASDTAGKRLAEVKSNAQDAAVRVKERVAS